MPQFLPVGVLRAGKKRTGSTGQVGPVLPASAGRRRRGASCGQGGGGRSLRPWYRPGYRRTSPTPWSITEALGALAVPRAVPSPEAPAMVRPVVPPVPPAAAPPLLFLFSLNQIEDKLQKTISRVWKLGLRRNQFCWKEDDKSYPTKSENMETSWG
jgi:hypothetical protein